MPIYEYIHENGSCDEGKDKFKKLQGLSEKPLAECPYCGKAVKRVISVPSKATKNILSASNIAEKGFTQFTRKDKGVYERTAGEGADFIVDKKEKLD